MYIFVYIFANLNSCGEFDYSKVCTFALTLKILPSSISKKSSRKLPPLRCTLLSSSIVILSADVPISIFAEKIKVYLL